HVRRREPSHRPGDGTIFAGPDGEQRYQVDVRGCETAEELPARVLDVLGQRRLDADEARRLVEHVPRPCFEEVAGRVTPADEAAGRWRGPRTKIRITAGRLGLAHRGATLLIRPTSSSRVCGSISFDDVRRGGPVGVFARTGDDGDVRVAKLLQRAVLVYVVARIEDELVEGVPEPQPREHPAEDVDDRGLRI